MRVTDLWIDRFGDWTSVDLRDLALGLNVVYFPDAATKTALVHFVPSVLYGFSESVRQRFISGADDHELVAGGTVTLELPQGRYRVTRHDRGRLGGELTIKNFDDELCPPDTLQHLLHQVDRSTYRETFVFPVRDFEGLGRLQGAELYARFARYGAIAEPQALADVRSGLARLRRQAWQALPRGVAEHQALCRTLSQEIQSLAANQRREESDLLRQQPELQSTLGKLKDEEARLQAEIEALTRKIAALENQPAPKPQPVKPAPQPQNDLQRRLAALQAKLDRWNRLLKRVQAKRSRLRAKITECAVDEALWRDSQHAVWFARQSESFHRLEQRATELHRRVAELVEQSETQGRVRTQQLVSLEPLAAALRGELHEISSELREYESRAYRHDVLVANERKLKEVQARLARQIRKATHRKHRLLCRCQAAHLVLDGQVPAAPPQPQVDVTLVQKAAAARAEELARLRQELEALRRKLIQAQSRRHSTQNQLDAVARRLAALRADKTIVEKRAELAAAEAAWEDATARWQRAAAAAHLLQASTARYGRSRHPEILAAASEYLRGLTSGRLTQVRARLVEGGLEVESRGQRWLPLGSLDSLDRKTLLFCLRLAAVGQQVQRGIHLPLLVDDVLGQFDSATCIAAARLLVTLSKRGHQLLYFTCRQEIAELFEDLQVPSRSVCWRGERLGLSTINGFDATDDGWTEAVSASLPAKRDDKADTLAVVDEHVTPPAEPARSLVPQARFRTVSDATFSRPKATAPYLAALSCSVSEIPSMDSESARLLREHDIRRIVDLLAAQAAELEQRLAHPALRASRLDEWQTEAILACRIPHISRRDLMLLMACGIQSPEELASLMPEALLSRLEARTKQHSVMAKDLDYARGRVRDWINWARNARPLPNTLERCLVTAPHFARQESGNLSDGLPSTGGSTATVSKVATDRTATVALATQVETPPETMAGWRFHLGMNSPVEEAPSIGHKTARRLSVLGVYSVADLLDADPDEIASRLGRRWISGTTVREWQAQAALVCRVPMLHGHDAQLLVSAGYKEPEQFAHLSARQLLNDLQPLINSPQGARILRGANPPDLAEVANWISWANHARSLRVA